MGVQAGLNLIYVPLLGVQSRLCEGHPSFMVVEVRYCHLFFLLTVSQLSSVAVRYIILKAGHEVSGLNLFKKDPN